MCKLQLLWGYREEMCMRKLGADIIGEKLDTHGMTATGHTNLRG